MSVRIRYTDEPLGDLRVVPDFLPRPEELVFRDEGVKVTIALSKRSVEYFKGEARKHHTQYQRMIRRLLDAYAEHHSRPSSARSNRTRAKLARAGGAMAGRAEKTEHAGAKKGRGAYWGRKADAKRESNKVRRENAKRAVRQGLADSVD